MPVIRAYGKSEELGQPLEVVALEEHELGKCLVGCGTEKKLDPKACKMT
jgi:hypothetical protein